MRMPVKVWREVVKIQRNFLWSGLSKRRRISWVKWSDICKPKKEGGLGIRDLRVVNLSLLAKWRWKLLSDEEDVWKNVIIAKYGQNVLGNARLDDGDVGNLAFPWLRDLCRLDKGEWWFNQLAVKELGRGNSIKFWKEVCGGEILCEPVSETFFYIGSKGCFGPRDGEVGQWSVEMEFFVA
jgi:hypothetical protein